MGRLVIGPFHRPPEQRRVRRIALEVSRACQLAQTLTDDDLDAEIQATYRRLRVLKDAQDEREKGESL